MGAFVPQTVQNLQVLEGVFHFDLYHIAVSYTHLDVYKRQGLNQGNYFQENYAGAKQDFAIRAGLI